MLRWTFDTLVPTDVFAESEIHWRFDQTGVMAYGFGYYNDRKKVKVYRASIFGSVHEIADIEFNETPVNPAMFDPQRQELGWLHPVYTDSTRSSRINSLVILNFKNGDLKRYYSADYPVDMHFMNAIDNVMVMFTPSSDTRIRLFEIHLNQAQESFSVNFLASIEYGENGQNLRWETFAWFKYFRDCLVYKNFNRLLHYDFHGKIWSRKALLCECDPPNASDWAALCGLSLYVVSSTDRIRLLKLDDVTLTWKQACTFTPFPQEPGYNQPQCLGTGDGQMVCSFTTKWTTTAESKILRIAIHCLLKKMPLKELCLRALWLHVRQMFPALKLLTDHEIWPRLMLSSVLNVDEYFGRKFTQSL